MAGSFDEILEAYRQVWKNRPLLDKGKSPEEILKEAIMRELEDRNSHPRVRKSIPEKYLFATSRIIESDLSSSEKVVLIQLHIELASQLKNGTDAQG
ncbi:hypothetical protein [Bacillus sp. KH172YL63]|uniref:hypothetical protein n=1 Tax=Bacillus sp. KH172YL63 TaxID=2709784 RepID=UPI0013E4DE3D|nr:hypothetical protein [Bacillus sp. KH172YL63]BCB04391.1 hypothetical protein KH172YL63_25240 [Bacillus sp. KH172YL63]